MKKLLIAAILSVSVAMGIWLARNWLDDHAWQIAMHSGTSHLLFMACNGRGLNKGDSSPSRPQDDQHVSPLRTPLARSHGICI